MRLFFSVFTVFLFFLPGFPEVSFCRGNEFSSAPYSRQQENQQFAAHFASRMRNILRNIFQERAVFNNRFSIRPAPAGKNNISPVPYLHEQGSHQILYIPHHISFFNGDKKNISKAVSLALLSAAGAAPHQEEKLRDSFLTAAITHDLASTFFLQFMPYNKYTPAARVLTSYGICPDLKTIFLSPVCVDHASGELYGEYSSLLLDALLRKKIFSGGDFQRIIRHIIQNGAEKQYDILAKLMKERLADKRTGQTANEFFRSHIRKTLSNVMLPQSVGELEKQYLLLTHFEAEDHSGNIVTFSLPQFTELIRKIKKPDILTVRLLQELLRLARIAPGDTADGLLKLRQCVIKARTSPGRETQKQLDETEQLFLQGLEKQAAIEKFLTSVEQFSLTPGTRFFRTMEVLNIQKKDPLLIPWGGELEKLLENADHFSRDPGGKVF